MQVCFDYDYIAFTAAAAAEDRSIRVTHKGSGQTKVFKNRTEFWGKAPKYDGGYLAERNAGAKKPFKPDDFEIEDVQEPEPVEFALNTAKKMIQGVLKDLKAKEYYGYIGGNDCFRHDLATLLPYKGNRVGLIKPILLPEVKKYLLEVHAGIPVMHTYEADDLCAMDSYAAYQIWKNTKKDTDKLVLVGVDKDYMGCEGWFYNPNKMQEPLEITGFGELRKEGKDVVGHGRLWLYFQVASGDTIDNYKANSASDVKWGAVSAYNALKDCKNDADVLKALEEIYQMLYPEPAKFKSFRGDTIQLDWRHALNENFRLAKMLRHEDDHVSVWEYVEEFA